MSTAADMVFKYLEAERAILEGKSISFNGRTMGMEDLDKVIVGRKEWEQRVAGENNVAACRPSIGGRTFSVANFRYDQ